MRFEPRSSDLDEARASAAAKLVAGVDSGHPSPSGLLHRARCRVAVLPVASVVRLIIGAAFPMPSAISGGAGGSPPGRSTSSTVGSTPLIL